MAKRKRISQSDVPGVSLEQALRVPEAIANNYSKEPTRPLDVAAALEMSPTSGPFRTLCGAAIGYGLTDGGPNAAQISLTALGLRIVAPTKDGDDQNARREAVLTPTVVREFLEKYDASPLPPERIARNVLETMAVPEKATDRVFNLIVDNASNVGFLKTIKDKQYVDIDAGGQSKATHVESDDERESGSLPEPDVADPLSDPAAPLPASAGSVAVQGVPSLGLANRKVFLTHGKSRKVVEQLKQLLIYGDFEPVVSVERESVSKPIPDKIMDDMRGCNAAIIHVRAEGRLMDESGEERRMLNQNVLIEIGAALALYGRNFILLVEEGTELPSNLQGLYEVRYQGDELGFDATMKVMKSLNDFKHS